MSSVSYDGKKLIPVQTVNIVKTYEKTGDGEIVGSFFDITVNGTIVVDKGSPLKDGSFHESSGDPADEEVTLDASLGVNIRKQEAIRELFSVEGKSLEVQSADGSQPMKCNPRVVSINIPEGQWVKTVPYSINLHADVIYVKGQPIGEDEFPQHISTASESWSFETDTGNAEGFVAGLNETYRLSHTVSAQGKRFYKDDDSLERPAWQQARDFVIEKLGFDDQIALSSGVNNLPDYYGGYNHIRNEQVDELGGSFSVTESWILTSGSALESISFSQSESADSLIKTVSVQGNITGLEEKTYYTDSPPTIEKSKYDNALERFNIVNGLAYSRAQSYSGFNLNVTPLRKTIGKNPTNGTINYSYEYDTRPTNVYPDALSEIITVSDSWDKDVFGIVPVLGRTAGPVLQALGSHHELTRTLNVEIVKSGVDFSSNLTAALEDKPNIQDLVNQVNPGLHGANKSFVQEQTENWEPKTGRYSYNVTWVYENINLNTGAGIRGNV